MSDGRVGRLGSVRQELSRHNLKWPHSVKQAAAAGEDHRAPQHSMPAISRRASSGWSKTVLLLLA
jgi:hypothetical protein